MGGLVRQRCQVYCWIGGDRPSDIEAAAYAHRLKLDLSFLTIVAVRHEKLKACRA
jgi:hypothetical protein